MNVSEFVSKWQKVGLTERSASQQHFLDLCEVFDHPKPALDDPSGERFTFEKGAAKHGGGQGWADVWKRSFFGWEYKGKHKDLNAAYDQLLRYREALESPPLLVVCDMDRFVIHTNFTATERTAEKVRESAVVIQPSASRTTNPFARSPYHSSAVRTDLLFGQADYSNRDAKFGYWSWLERTVLTRNLLLSGRTGLRRAENVAHIGA